jgi:hypothetical protein
MSVDRRRLACGQPSPGFSAPGPRGQALAQASWRSGRSWQSGGRSWANTAIVALRRYTWPLDLRSGWPIIIHMPSRKCDERARRHRGRRRRRAAPVPGARCGGVHDISRAYHSTARRGRARLEIDSGGNLYSAGAIRPPAGGFACSLAVSSASQTLWCSLAQLTSTLPSHIASNAPSIPMVPI